MEILELDLTSIKPYWRNPRHNAHAVAAVAQSIHDYGYNVPIIVDTDRVIVAGHTRYRALQSLGWTKAPCVITDLPPEKAKAYRIADNKTSEIAGWDMGNLIAELREIEDVPAFQVYFPNLDLDNLIAETAGSTYTPPTQTKIENADATMKRDFLERNQREMSGFIDLVCPDCGTEFSMARGDLTKELSEKD